MCQFMKNRDRFHKLEGKLELSMKELTSYTMSPVVHWEG